MDKKGIVQVTKAGVVDKDGNMFTEDRFVEIDLSDIPIQQLDQFSMGYVVREQEHRHHVARGAIPWKEGDELPEDVIRRMRDA